MANEAVEKKAEKVKTKTNKPSFGERLKKVWKDFKAEFKKIVWSSKRNTFNNTVLVVVSMIVIAICIGVLDFAFGKLIAWLGTLI